MTDLADFLLARIAEDEAVAHGSHGIGDGDGVLRPAWPEGILAGRARMLAECEAKRRIVEEVEEHVDVQDAWSGWVILRALALPYADHPDWREEWKP